MVPRHRRELEVLAPGGTLLAVFDPTFCDAAGRINLSESMRALDDSTQS